MTSKKGKRSRNYIYPIFAAVVIAAFFSFVGWLYWNGTLSQWVDDYHERLDEQVKSAGYNQNWEHPWEREVNWSTKTDKEGNVLFTNNTGGFKLTIPAGMTADEDGVVDADVNSAATRIMLAGGIEMEVFTEHFTDMEEKNTYLEYSHSFLEDEKTYTETDSWQAYSSKGTKDRYVYTWKRPELTLVGDDKPYYLCEDMVFGYNRQSETKVLRDEDGNKIHGQSVDVYRPADYKVISLMFKASRPVLAAEVEEIVNSAEPVSYISRKVPPGEDTREPRHEILRDYWSRETKDAYRSCFGDDADLSWGLYDVSAPDEMKTLKKMEEEMAYKFRILVYYWNFEPDVTDQLVEAMKTAKAEDRYLELSLQTTEKKTGNMMFDVMNGKYDTFLKHMAENIAETQQPVLFRFGNEMNGDWCAYNALKMSKDAEIYVDAYRHAYDIFEEEGALPYTIWVWNPNHRSFPDYNWNSEYLYYPGDKYVDVVGMTAYNTGTYYESEKWTEFADLYDGLYDRMASDYAQPLMITEFASSSVGGNKLRWLDGMFDRIGDYKRLKVAVWWNSCDYDEDDPETVSRPYWITETPYTQARFAKGLAAQRTAQSAASED
ncbi:MAG: hypothetical protein K5767_06325 [Clostridia bacterium]|nr:hypothetical protein [Clostridia bacterium]